MLKRLIIVSLTLCLVAPANSSQQDQPGFFSQVGSMTVGFFKSLVMETPCPYGLPRQTTSAEGYPITVLDSVAPPAFPLNDICEQFTRLKEYFKQTPASQIVGDTTDLAYQYPKGFSVLGMTLLASGAQLSGCDLTVMGTTATHNIMSFIDRNIAIHHYLQLLLPLAIGSNTLSQPNMRRLLFLSMFTVVAAQTYETINDPLVFLFGSEFSVYRMNRHTNTMYQVQCEGKFGANIYPLIRPILDCMDAGKEMYDCRHMTNVTFLQQYNLALTLQESSHMAAPPYSHTIVSRVEFFPSSLMFKYNFHLDPQRPGTIGRYLTFKDPYSSPDLRLVNVPTIEEIRNLLSGNTKMIGGALYTILPSSDWRSSHCIWRIFQPYKHPNATLLTKCHSSYLIGTKEIVTICFDPERPYNYEIKNMMTTAPLK